MMRTDTDSKLIWSIHSEPPSNIPRMHLKTITTNSRKLMKLIKLLGASQRWVAYKLISALI